MAYYHCSPTAGLKVLEPRKPESFEKPARVYMTTLLSMALMYTVRNYEYSYGYTKEGQIYFDEYFPNALEILYRGKSASLYLCDPESTKSTRIPNEAISETAVPVISETFIPDACEALLEQERLGTLVIHRYHELSTGMLNWIRKVEADGIRKSNLLNTPGPMADYYREHYPESWAIVEAEEKLLLYHGSAIPALNELQPLSQLHDSNQKVVYLSSSIPYVLLYIWDAGKTSYSKKWVTGWIRDGIAHYEEQFPGQLNLSKLSRAEIEAELLRDREILQHYTDIPVVGHAFPFGATGKNVNCILKENDFLYARTVMNTMGYSKKRFTFPDDSLKLNPTCWHIDKDIEKLLDIFLSTPAENEDMLFYMWGHGYELDFEAMKRRKFWDTFERMLDKVACDDSVIKCTNAEAVRAHLSNEI